MSLSYDLTAGVSKSLDLYNSIECHFIDCTEIMNAKNLSRLSGTLSNVKILSYTVTLKSIHRADEYFNCRLYPNGRFEVERECRNDSDFFVSP